MSRARRVPGRGAAMARQMGLLSDPDAGESPGDPGGDEALEAELLLLLGGREAPEAGKPSPPPQQALAAVEALAQLCLRDPPEEEEEEEGEEDLENEEELLAELQEVLEEGSGSAAAAETPQEPADARTLLVELSERAELYRAALTNAATENGNGARFRRLQRGLNTLEHMLESVRSGKQINEAEIPPPVAVGKGGGAPALPPPVSPEPQVQPPAPPAGYIPPRTRPGPPGGARAPRGDYRSRHAARRLRRGMPGAPLREACWEV